MPALAARLDPVKAGRRLANYLSVLTLEAQTIARACGKSHLHNLEPEDMVALTIEAAAMAQVPLAGTNWIPGQKLLTGMTRTMTIDLAAVAAKERASNISSSPTRISSAASAPSWFRPRPLRGMQKNGAGFAGFATWLDMSPADPDMFAMPDAPR